MKNLNAKIISQAIISSIVKIEKDIGYKIMFGAVGGSYALGLQNNSSDIDCYLLVDDERLFQVIHQKVDIVLKGEPISVDLMCVAYKEVLREVEKYNKEAKQYPSVWYRTEEDKRNYIGKGDIDRPDFKRSILFRILLSDVIINKELAKTKYMEYRDGIKIADIIDYHYVRIYGNYYEKIKDMEFVPIRKYLYTIHEICTCVCLMNSVRKPPMDIIELVNHTISDASLKDKINCMYKKNFHSVKDKRIELIYKDQEINQYILESMDVIANYLERDTPISGCLDF